MHCVLQLGWPLILFHKNLSSSKVMKLAGSTDSIKIYSLLTGKNESNSCLNFFYHTTFFTHIKEENKWWHILQIYWYLVSIVTSVEVSKLERHFKANVFIKATSVRNPLFSRISNKCVKIPDVKAYSKIQRNCTNIVLTQNIQVDIHIFLTKKCKLPLFKI